MEKKTIPVSKIIVPLSGSLDEVKNQTLLSKNLADMFEARVDLLHVESITFLKSVDKPLILTLKPFCEKQLFDQYKRTLLLKPAYIDIDYKWISCIDTGDYPLIISCHDRLGASMLETIAIMQKKTKHLKNVIIKVAIDQCSALEFFEVLDLLKRVNKDKICVIAIFTGEKGRFMRLITPLYAPQFSFVSADDKSKTDPGQISIDELSSIYKPWKSLKPLPIYALLGNPTAQSRGPFFHNTCFTEKNHLGLYVTIDLEKGEAESFLTRAIASNLFKGFSVTMPYKRAFSSITNTIEPINTLALVNQKWESVNTDGKAALELIGEHIEGRGSHLVILGTGGTAKAIANEAKKEGMHVTLISRDRDKQMEGFKVKGYDDLESLNYDALVQATPSGFKGEKGSITLKSKMFLKGKVFLECVQSERTPFIEQVRNKGGIIIHGSDLFERQALLQSSLFTKA